MFPPRISEAEASELKLDSYLMHINQTHCSRCDSGERFAELYEVWIHPTKTPKTGYRQLRRIATGGKTVLDPKLHIEYVEMPEHAIPICSDCVHTYRSATDKTAIPLADPAAWAETLKRKYAPPSAEPRVARTSEPKGKHIPRLDEL